MNINLSNAASMANHEVKLLAFWGSPFSKRVEWALTLKGVEHELKLEDLSNKSSLLLEANPIRKLVPVLIHGGKSICESLFIIEYIDETWPQNPLFPQDPCEKAKTRFWAKFAEEKLAQGARNILNTVGETQDNEVEQFQEALDVIEKEAKGKENKFFGGESVGCLDLILGWTILWLEGINEVSCERKIVDRKRYPCFSKWRDDLGDLSLIKENSPDKGELFAYLQKIRLLSTTKK